MYIDKIDDFVDKFFDDYFINIFKKNNFYIIIKFAYEHIKMRSVK